MITKTVHSEFGDYEVKMNHGYKVRSYIDSIDAYKSISETNNRWNGEWSKCPCCNLEPKVLIYDNGVNTACGCSNSKYDHFSICSESIMSVHRRTNGKRMDKYATDDLRKNWNEYCVTMINPCSDYELQLEGKW